jgi:hypothetical protein
MLALADFAIAIISSMQPLGFAYDRSEIEVQIGRSNPQLLKTLMKLRHCFALSQNFLSITTLDPAEHVCPAFWMIASVTDVIAASKSASANTI